MSFFFSSLQAPIMDDLLRVRHENSLFSEVWSVFLKYTVLSVFWC